jgi:hypothetical protein
MNRSSRFFLMLLLTSALTASATSAGAQEDPRKAQAEPMFQEGVKFHEQKRSVEALDRFEKAYKIYPSPNTLVNIAREEQLLGRKLAALRHLREALTMPLLNPKSATVARQYVSELEPVLGRVEVKGPAGMTVNADDRSYTLPLTEPLDADPGTVLMDGKFGDTRYHGRVVAIAGKSVVLEMVPESAQAAGPPAPSEKASSGAGEPASTFTPPPSSDTGRSFWTTRHTLGLTSGALAVVAAGAGVGFLIAREGHVSDENSIASANPRACVDVNSAPCRDFKEAGDAKGATETGAIISFIAAGVFGAGAAAFFLWPDGSSSTGARARVVPTGRGVSVVGTF